MNYLVKILLILVILTTLGNLVSQVILWAPPVSDNDSAIGGGEKKPEISVNISTAVTPDASGKVPEGGVNIAGNTASVVVPEGVQMTEGATELTLSVESISEPNEDVPVAEGETANSIDVHIDGVAEDNTVPMLITLKKLFSKGLNTTSVKMYHVENGAPVEMALVSDPANHNEFSYDPATGDVVMCVASFSEYVTVEDDFNLWEGGFDYSWYEGKSSPYTISTAEQLAGLGAIVDGGYTKPDGTTVTLTADDFAGKTILLGADIDLYGTDESGNRLSFNPIGFKYPGAKDDEDNDISKIFRGTFDGQNHTIKNLYQNGWDMGLSYSNAGGGLFAGVQNATIKNLTMKGADIVMEAVPMGTVAAYAYGNCTFDHIRITQSTLQNYNWDIAAIVGGVNGTHTFSDIHIDNTVTLSSLWGSFGGGIGGVIGSVYGGNNGNNSVTMKNVDVACVLDVYNDVTSAYQWYAYRFCGMLIGNTNEPGADGKNAKTAAASFLKCENVKVYYGDWVNYHYCKFTNQDIAWQNNYPWVRVEEGLSNSGYSNARYGHPIVDGVAVTAENHVHRENDGDCNLLIEFNQLYGGDQGVYGQPTHEGVTVQNYYYKVEYINDGNVYHCVEVTTPGEFDVVTNGQNAVEPIENDMGEGYEFNYWMNAGSSQVTTISSGNMKDVKLYPSFKDRYTATFVDQQGNILAWGIFTNKNYTNITTLASTTTPPVIENCEFDYWQVQIKSDNGTITKTKIDNFSFANTKKDVTIYPVYTFNGDVNLIPVDTDGDGEPNYYEVGGYSKPDGQDLVEIPDEVNGIPVTTVNKNAFSGYPGVHVVVLPKFVEFVGDNAMSDASIGGFLGIRGDGETITLYYSGSKEEWLEREASFDSKWDFGMSENSKIYFLNGGDKVDPTQGYLQAVHHTSSSWGSVTLNDITWTSYTIDQNYINTMYTRECDCKEGDHDYGISAVYDRIPDYIYWGAEDGSGAITIPTN